MNPNLSLAALLGLLAWFAVTLATRAAESPSGLWAGTAKVEITPAEDAPANPVS